MSKRGKGRAVSGAVCLALLLVCASAHASYIETCFRGRRGSYAENRTGGIDSLAAVRAGVELAASLEVHSGIATPSLRSASGVGVHWDPDVGLSYAQQRWYDPGVGRFLSEDPVFGQLSEPMSLQRFAYANGNPVRWTDPTGERVFIVTYGMYFGTSHLEDPAQAFRKAAETRARQIRSNRKFNPKTDYVIVLGMTSPAQVKEKIEWWTQKLEALGYGKTVEFSWYGHAGLEGPSFDQQWERPTTIEDKNQLSLDEWRNIDFNWESSGTLAAFYGCQSLAFASLFQKVQAVSEVAGLRQGTYGYPSRSPTRRVYPIVRGIGPPGSQDDVYIVGQPREVSNTMAEYMYDNYVKGIGPNIIQSRLGNGGPVSPYVVKATNGCWYEAWSNVDPEGLRDDEPTLVCQ